jgi:hypothetical protein
MLLMVVAPIVIRLSIYKRVHHLLKPMVESAIKAEVFPSVKKKKGLDGEFTSKPRMSLLQEEEDDVNVPAPIITASIVDVPIITAANGTPDIQIAAYDIYREKKEYARSAWCFLY